MLSSPAGRGRPARVPLRVWVCAPTCADRAKWRVSHEPRTATEKREGNACACRHRKAVELACTPSPTRLDGDPAPPGRIEALRCSSTGLCLWCARQDCVCPSHVSIPRARPVLPNLISGATEQKVSADSQRGTLCRQGRGRPLVHFCKNSPTEGRPQVEAGKAAKRPRMALNKHQRRDTILDPGGAKICPRGWRQKRNRVDPKFPPRFLDALSGGAKI